MTKEPNDENEDVDVDIDDWNYGPDVCDDDFNDDGDDYCDDAGDDVAYADDAVDGDVDVDDDADGDDRKWRNTANKKMTEPDNESDDADVGDDDGLCHGVADKVCGQQSSYLKA